MHVLRKFANSRKFWLAVAGVLIPVMVEFIPILQPLEDNLTEMLVVIGLGIAGYAAEDFGKAANGIRR